MKHTVIGIAYRYAMKKCVYCGDMSNSDAENFQIARTGIVCRQQAILQGPFLSRGRGCPQTSRTHVYTHLTLVRTPFYLYMNFVYPSSTCMNTDTNKSTLVISPIINRYFKRYLEFVSNLTHNRSMNPVERWNSFQPSIFYILFPISMASLFNRSNQFNSRVANSQILFCSAG